MSKRAWGKTAGSVQRLMYLLKGTAVNYSLGKLGKRVNLNNDWGKRLFKSMDNLQSSLTSGV